MPSFELSSLQLHHLLGTKVCTALTSCLKGRAGFKWHVWHMSAEQSFEHEVEQTNFYNAQYSTQRIGELNEILENRHPACCNICATLKQLTR